MAAPIKSTALYQAKYVIAPSIAIPAYLNTNPELITLPATSYPPTNGTTTNA